MPLLKLLLSSTSLTAKALSQQTGCRGSLGNSTIATPPVGLVASPSALASPSVRQVVSSRQAPPVASCPDTNWPCRWGSPPRLLSPFVNLWGGGSATRRRASTSPRTSSLQGGSRRGRARPRYTGSSSSRETRQEKHAGPTREFTRG
jgi:hypothetical protein